MEKIIKIVKIEPQSKGQKHWVKVHTDDGKATNMFPNTPGYNVIAEGKTVSITLEKNEETGYWDILNIADVAGTPTQSAQNGQQVAPAPQPTQSIPATNRDEQIARQVAFKGAVELIGGGYLKTEDIYNATEDFTKFLMGEFKPVHKDSWLSSYINK